MQKQLSDGLILRSLSEGHESDQEGMGKFYADVFGEDGHPTPNMLDIWTQDLISDRHPTTTLDDLWVVVDPGQNGRIVSALLLIPQTWRYEDVEFGVGRVELVATHKDYRNRGLIRALIDAAHERSAALGHVVQGITGIPHYYRRFGYAFAVDLGGRAGLNLDAVPNLKEGETPKYALRRATSGDIPKLVEWDRYYARQCLLSHVRTAEMWHYELKHRNPGAPFYVHPYVIVRVDGEEVGYVTWSAVATRPYLSVLTYIVGENSSYLETFDDVIRGIKSFVEMFFAEHPENKPIRIGFDGGISTALDMLIDRTSSGVVRETIYAWYIRVADIAGFIRAIAPVLERRLVGSGANCFSGQIKISFYDQSGLMLTFDKGRIVDVKQGEVYQGKADAAFPYHSFLNVVFGHRTIAELNHVLPECFANRNAFIVLSALFPKKRSWLMAMA